MDPLLRRFSIISRRCDGLSRTVDHFLLELSGLGWVSRREQIGEGVRKFVTFVLMDGGSLDVL